MRIMIGVGHPKHVHFRKNVIRNLLNNGHEVKIVARKKDITLQLLDAYGFDYEVVGTNYKGLIKKAYGMMESDIKLLNIARKFKPDILVGGSPYLGHVSRLIGKPHIGFTDTEHATLTNCLSNPFSDVICTPSCYKGRIDPKKHVCYDGYEELAYLHPNYFKPDPSVLEEVGLSKQDRFIIVRFVSWNASHDFKQTGLCVEKSKYISKFEQYGRVFISSESQLPPDLEKYKLKINPEKFHSLLSYAHLYFGEGGSTATEAALLGTPSIHISTTAIFCGVFDDLLKYNLVYSFDDDRKALQKAISILSDKKSKEMWIHRKNNMLKEKVDVTRFITELIEKYPENLSCSKSGVK